MKNKNNIHEFSVWPLMIDMLSSVFIIYIVQSTILSPEAFERLQINQKRGAFLIELNEKLKIQINNQQVSLEPKFDYLKITFSDLILFDKGEYVLKNTGKNILGALSSLIPVKGEKDSKISKIQVEGHTDVSKLHRTEYPKNNWELSSARAIEVVDFFISQNRKPSLFSANGFGQFNPVSTMDIKKNRRIEIKVYFSEDSRKK
ncbi:MAG: flagellar motor protein MotB [Saprospiraceae bacterium]